GWIISRFSSAVLLIQANFWKKRVVRRKSAWGSRNRKKSKNIGDIRQCTAFYKAVHIFFSGKA
ncbi:MAG: hypothetical protein BWK80_43895, partial [Desulfobacteraceae bacterium IS3]